MKESKISKSIPSSFRDPSGFLFSRDSKIFRQINTVYRENYLHLMRSGLYESLVERKLLIPHKEVSTEPLRSDTAYKIIQPEGIPFVSYPYEWCFSQLKSAALTTLKIQKVALDFGMSLKDCSAYNIQFRKGKPVFIDTLSFEKYRAGQPWIAYRQFCQHFFAPLALMCYGDIRLNKLLMIHIDGIPLDLASRLLSFADRLKPALFFHIYLHSKSQKFFGNKNINTKNWRLSRHSFLGLIDSLESAVKKLVWKPQSTQWTAYYKNTDYSQEAFDHKKKLVSLFLDKINPADAWDLGANTGTFSRIAGKRGIQVFSFDADPAVVEKNYLKCVDENEENILPLLLDLTNPSPDIGWQNRERIAFMKRGPADTVLALALVHHLAISNNIPLDKIAGFFNNICDRLIIEFVPKSDSQVQRFLSSRTDIFPNYTKQAFENAFGRYFAIRDCVKIKGSQRTLHLMEKQKPDQ